MAEEEYRALATEALRLTRFCLQEKLPFLDEALALPGVRWTEGSCGTDGVDFYWDSRAVLRLFKESPLMLQRLYLHLLLHGLYLHAFRHPVGQGRVWDLASDILTEYRIDRMDVPEFRRPVPAKRSCVYRELREKGVLFSERRLAGCLKGLAASTLQEWEEIFRRDSHERWGKPGLLETEAAQQTGPQASPEGPGRVSEAAQRFREVFERLNLRSEEHRRQAGGSAGGQSQAITLEKERGYDYRRFLKRFAVNQEELCLDMDSFDYIPYDYSRRMYERLVFLEPLEYQEVKKLSEFVIAIDTSGSCSGEVVRMFLEETWKILSERENLFRQVDIHIIQCDCVVQEHVRITCEEEWKEYLSQVTIKGHGDTDFTPVFRLVDKMLQDGTLRRLKGLLYFTDGDGIYPDRSPEYETAFVYLNEELRKGRAPAWALTLTLDRELRT